MAILFDFDGTLVDTFPDLMDALDIFLVKHRLPKISANKIKPIISFGAKVILTKAVPEYFLAKHSIDKLRKDFIDIYLSTNFKKTKPFPGIIQLLDKLIASNFKWGIVTNRTCSLTKPLLDKFSLAPSSNCLIGGDSTPEPKPSPVPLLAASKLLNLSPNNCIYIGDAATDISAGNSAGMHTIAALFGYIPSKNEALNWPANAYATTVEEILPLILSWQTKQT